MKHHIHELEAISVNRPSGPTGATPDPIAAEMGPQKLLYGAHPLARNIGESLAIPQGHRGDNPPQVYQGNAKSYWGDLGGPE
jgi:hypothetical protein